MSLESRIASLRSKHGVLDERILQEQAHHAPDSILLSRLKSEKLHIKEEIDRLSEH